MHLAEEVEVRAGEGQAMQLAQPKYNDDVDGKGHTPIHMFFEDGLRARDGGCGNLPATKMNGSSACGWPEKNP